MEHRHSIAMLPRTIKFSSPRMLEEEQFYSSSELAFGADSDGDERDDERPPTSKLSVYDSTHDHETTPSLGDSLRRSHRSTGNGMSMSTSTSYKISQQLRSPPRLLYVVVVLTVLLIYCIWRNPKLTHQLPRNSLFGHEQHPVLAPLDDSDLEVAHYEPPPPVPAAESIQAGKNREAAEEAVQTMMNSYVWQLKPVHESLSNMLKTLSKEDLRVRQWLIETRPVSMAGTPVGLASSSSSPRIREGPAMARIGSGPGKYIAGARDKYDDLVREYETGRPSTGCPSMPWARNYTILHNAILQGKKPVKVFQATCPATASCGGIADRSLGLFTSFLYAILTDRAFFIEWDNWPFELLADAVHIDWSQPTDMQTGLARHPKMGVTKSRILLPMIDLPDDYVDAFLIMRIWSHMRDHPFWIRFWTNRGAVFRSFNYGGVSDVLKEKGLVRSSAYACLSEYLFRPKANALRFMVQYTSLFALPSVFSVALQIRTGDQSMEFAKNDHSDAASHRAFFECAEKVSARLARPDQKIVYYLVSDSEALKRAALNQYGDRVILSGLSAAHPEIAAEDLNPVEEKKRVLDGASEALIEGWLLGKTDFQILSTDSGFGKIPVWSAGKEGRTIQMPKTETGIDCSSPDAIASFDKMAASW
ncbi:BQ5605_C015g07818 [Microbotryum silenes-dioicae]|uniref:BQ5605_C015g07818 protein n=1 Tax=Microbotryum silenes-dioicae TaxID=796604 RepID=A0A2X0LWP2_9BASI|nr:BQ5605_C015g07818 [Microbotryum silenes-dioicae]